MSKICGEYYWNLVEETWDESEFLYWACFADKIRGKTFSDAELAIEEEFGENINNTKGLREDLIKVYVTIHNKFLDESSAKMIKLAGAFPTYEDQKIIESDVKAAVELTKNSKITEPMTDIEIQNVKIGFQQIIEHVSNKSTK